MPHALGNATISEPEVNAHAIVVITILSAVSNLSPRFNLNCYYYLYPTNSGAGEGDGCAGQFLETTGAFIIVIINVNMKLGID